MVMDGGAVCALWGFLMTACVLGGGGGREMGGGKGERGGGWERVGNGEGGGWERGGGKRGIWGGKLGEGRMGGKWGGCVKGVEGGGWERGEGRVWGMGCRGEGEERRSVKWCEGGREKGGNGERELGNREKSGGGKVKEIR